MREGKEPMLMKDAKAALLRPEVAEFAYEMERKLRANEHRGGWKRCWGEYLSSELSKNLSKLNAALKNKNKSEVLRRSVNIGNYAMMIADNYGRLLEQEVQK